MRRVTLRHRIHRGLGQLRKLICIVRGRHVEADSEWGYGWGGVIDLYCPNCLQIVRQIALDDIDNLDEILEVIEFARKL